MKKIIEFRYFSLIVLVLLTIPTFWTMLKPGIFSMQDPHVFRMYQFDKCINDGQIPCRWAPDSAYEYGQPVFVFYGQLTYWFGEIFRLLGLSIIDSTKALFISSFILAALSMYLLSRQLWGNNWSAILSALIYSYAPYRAVDVYVRGALPESLAFSLFPLIIYFFNEYIKNKKSNSLILFGLSYSALILVHNLSVLMFSIFFALWAIYLLTLRKAWKTIINFLIVGIFILGLTAFYTVPVIFESSLVTLEKTTQGFFDYNAHFVTIRQLLLSDYWGYGASLFGEDDRLSLAVGYMQWILPLILAISLITKFKRYINFYVITLGGWLMLWLAHNKSAFIWAAIPVFAFIQFPWRFLGLAVFCFALASGVLFTLIEKNIYKTLILVIVVVILLGLNGKFFHEDLWFKISDQEQFSGKLYEPLAASSINDFWPKTARVTPVNYAPKDPIISVGEGNGQLLNRNSYKASYKVTIISENAEVQLPIVYFPGWEVTNSGLLIYPKGDYGLITSNLPQGEHIINLEFKNTSIRNIGNVISLIALVVFLIYLAHARFSKNKSN